MRLERRLQRFWYGTGLDSWDIVLFPAITDYTRLSLNRERPNRNRPIALY